MAENVSLGGSPFDPIRSFRGRIRQTCFIDIISPDRRIILASASPRRIELLARLVPAFDVVPANLEESPLRGEAPEATAERLAHAKAHAVLARHPDAFVIAGDTVVGIEDDQLAKPEDADDAARMLARLSGREHRIITAMCLSAEMKRDCLFSEITRVTFRALTDEEIRAYVTTGEPMDKAGAYAIQGGARGFMTSIEGSWSNAVGLPLERLEPILRRQLN